MSNLYFVKGRNQQGAVLLASLLILVAITLVSVTSMQSGIQEYRIAGNMVFGERAFQASETGRGRVSQILDEHLFERDWPATLTIPSGVTILDKDSDGNKDMLYTENGAGEDINDVSTLIKDVEVRIDGNGDGDYTDKNDIQTDLYVYKARVQFGTGSGAAMMSGYEGLGKGAAAGGGQVYYELRSQGLGTGSAEAWTSSDFMGIIKN